MLLIRKNLLYSVLFLLSAVLSSFTVFSAEDTPKSEEKSSPEISVSDDSSSSLEDDNAKDKRSREEIMFGNQQNKAAGLVDDIMGMAQRYADKSSENMPAETVEKKSNTTSEDEEKAAEFVDMNEKDEKRNIQSYEDTDPNEIGMMMGPGSQNWYHAAPVPNNALQYLVNAPLQSLPSEEFSNNLYDQEDLYRRKRQLLGHALPLRKRSLRSSLGQMIQKRGIRLPRRSMRLKRQTTNVEDLLSMLGNLQPADRNIYFEEQVPGRFSTGGYPETPAAEFRYPYSFLQPGNELEDNNADNMDDTADDIDSLMLMPPNSRYVNTPDLGLQLPYRTREEESDAVQEWLSRHTTPSVFPIARRSSPIFYPYDYRYVPTLKKRSRFMPNNGRLGNRISTEEEPDSDFGKWGQVVQLPEAYASGEDVARLYALANLMTEGEGSEAKMHGSA